MVHDAVAEVSGPYLARLGPGDGEADGATRAIGSAYINKYGSSKKIKTNKQPIEDAEILSEVKTLPVEKWDYKAGEGDEGEHVGPYAEDVQAKFGDKAAPGGKAIDIISMNGITLSAVKGLSKQVDKLEKKVANIAARGIGRA